MVVLLMVVLVGAGGCCRSGGELHGTLCPPFCPRHPNPFCFLIVLALALDLLCARAIVTVAEGVCLVDLPTCYCHIQVPPHYQHTQRGRERCNGDRRDSAAEGARLKWPRNGMGP